MRALASVELAYTLSGSMAMPCLENHMPKILQLKLSKHTLGHFDLPLVLLKELQHQLDMLEMFFIGAAVDKNIMEENEHTFPKEWS